MGGEKVLLPHSRQPFWGSPPRGRGKGRCNHLVIFVDGITPAQAGKSCFSYFLESSVWDHPRTGGEKLLLVLLGEQRVGSPPHRRGKEPLSFTSAACPGITPAWAGKSLLPYTKLSMPEDHPRVGGEKDKAEHLVQHHIGITPAQAGKS